MTLDIRAPASLIWTYLPGVRVRPGVTKQSLNGLSEGSGALFDLIYRDSSGTVTRHDRIQVAHWEPGVRFVAKVVYLPPWPPLEIIYNVDLKESGGTTHFVMDSYTTVTQPDGPDPAARREKQRAQEREWQAAVEKAYGALKQEIEAEARRRSN